MTISRTGIGFDVHRFDMDGKGCDVMLCGIAVASMHPLIGHSDADVALHAVTDALLGAIAAGDIGDHFSDKDERWKGADSSMFVRHALQLAMQRNARLTHLDVTIICERPKISPHKMRMKQGLMELLSLDDDSVNIKATTTEGLGFAGRGEGIAAQAVATIIEGEHERELSQHMLPSSQDALHAEAALTSPTAGKDELSRMKEHKEGSGVWSRIIGERPVHKKWSDKVRRNREVEMLTAHEKMEEIEGHDTHK